MRLRPCDHYRDLNPAYWVVELRGVPVGGPNAQRDHRALRQLGSANLASFEGAPVAKLDGRLKAQKFIPSGIYRTGCSLRNMSYTGYGLA